MRTRICLHGRSRRCVDLDHFLADYPQNRLWLCQPGFARFYVRKSLWQPTPALESRHCIELANIQAYKPGEGAFKALISEVRSRYRCHYVLAECVLTDRFIGGLKRIGFVPLDPASDRYSRTSLYLAT